jgi:glycerate-2-kinase
MVTYLENLFRRTLEACSPQRAVSKAVSLEEHILTMQGSSFKLNDRPLHVLAAGKASVPMYEALHEIAPDHIKDSLVITPNPTKGDSVAADKLIQGAHPEPTEQSLKAGQQARDFFSDIPDDALVINLISGGTSSLMCLPAEGIGINELNRTFGLMNHSGADIYAMNTVRKHCSQLKGGQLLRFLPASTSVVDLIISDVPGDDPAIIGSSPTTPDSSTFLDAREVLTNYTLWDKVPQSIRTHIRRGIKGETAETLKPHENPIAEHTSHIISSARQFARQAANLAKEDGYECWVADTAYNKPVGEVAQDITQMVKGELDKGDNPKILIFYGESTVQVTGSGKGGRNQELALRGAFNIADMLASDEHTRISWLSAGTDGIDGPTDAAGAVVNHETIQQARDRGTDPETYLRDNDSYHFHQQMDTLLKTGPSGNNLMDVAWVTIEPYTRLPPLSR